MAKTTQAEKDSEQTDSEQPPYDPNPDDSSLATIKADEVRASNAPSIKDDEDDGDKAERDPLVTDAHIAAATAARVNGTQLDGSGGSTILGIDATTPTPPAAEDSGLGEALAKASRENAGMADPDSDLGKKAAQDKADEQQAAIDASAKAADDQKAADAK